MDEQRQPDPRLVALVEAYLAERRAEIEAFINALAPSLPEARAALNEALSEAPDDPEVIAFKAEVEFVERALAKARAALAE